MDKADWIWIDVRNNADEYAHFVDSFSVTENREVVLEISTDSDYTVWINGVMVAFGQYADYPYHKVFDRVSISKFVKPGLNTLAICAYYVGADFFTYYKGNAGLIYEISQDSKILAFSGKKTKCRKATDYVSGRKEKITGQLGYNYCYFSGGNDNWTQHDYKVGAEFTQATVRNDITKDLHIRPIKKLELGERCVGKIIKHGSFEFVGEGSSAAKQQNAVVIEDPKIEKISNNEDNETAADKILGKKNDTTQFTAKKGGVFALFDLGREEVGFLYLKIHVKQAAKLSIGFGEHIADGRVRSCIEGRNFAVEYIAKSGEQEYLNTFRRLGARYLQVFAECDDIEINEIAIVPTTYSLQINPYRADSALRQKIYDVSVRTLQLCMHEHYEDCPWREQSFYSMDSRNQMLCGYFAFSEYKFARESLRLIGLDNRKDGLLSICFPSRGDLAIPSFSLYYLLAMREYIDYSGDISLAIEFYDKMQSLIKTFIGKMEHGLVPNFHGDANMWNFYEWADGLEGKLGKPDEKSVDLILNALLSLSLSNMSAIARALNKKDDELFYNSLANDLNLEINNCFFDKRTNLYKDFEHNEHYSELGNSFAILCGAANEDKSVKIVDSFYKDSNITRATLSMLAFKYDAFLYINKEKYKNIILCEIEKNYAFMLNAQASTFWETMKGEADFNNAGSLCHGWSALPIYYFRILA